MSSQLVRQEQLRKPDDPDDQLNASEVSGIEASAVNQEEFWNGVLSQFKRILHGDDVGDWHDNPVTKFGGDASLKALYTAIITGRDWQESVLDKDLATPPGSPPDGARYIVASGGTGDWNGHDDEITEWRASTTEWLFFSPTAGTTTLVEDEAKFYVYDGASWGIWEAIIDHGLLVGLGDDDHGHYHTDARGDVRYPTRGEWKQNGFENQTDSTLTWTDSSPDRTLAVHPAVTSFDYWVEGVRHTSTGDTRQITDVEGIHVIYYDGATLTSTANPSDAEIASIIRTKAIVAIIYWDTSAGTAIYVGEERHGKCMAPETHEYLHFVEGLRYLSGLGLNNMDVDGSGNDASAAQFGVDAGSVSDEDLRLGISLVGQTTGLPIYYMFGAAADWQRHLNAGYSVRTYDGTPATRLAWNEYTGGAWQLTQVGNGNFVLCHVFATTEKDKPMLVVMGQAEYSTKKAARAGALTEVMSLVLNDLLFPEIRPVATVIFETRTIYTNDVKGRVISTEEGDGYIDWRSEVVSRAVVGTTDHGSLAGLGDDDHVQYILTDGTRAYTGTGAGFLDEDNLGSDSAVAAASQQSIKAYVDALSHLDLDDIGVNTHIAIDAHIDAVAIHFTESSIDHGALQGRNDDDHTQYVLVNGTRAMTGNLQITKVAPTIIFTDLGGATLHNDWSVGTLVNDYIIQNIDSGTTGYLVLDHFIRVYPSIPNTPIFGQYFAMLFDATVAVTAVSSLGIFKDNCVIDMGGIYSNYTAMNASPTIRSNNVTAGVAYLFISQPTTYTNTLGQSPAQIRSFDHRGNIEARSVAGAICPLNMGLGDLSRCAAVGTNATLAVADWITIGNFSAADPGGYGLGVVFASPTCTCVVTNRIIFNAVDTVLNGEGGTETIVNQYGLKIGDLVSATTINCGAWIGEASGATANYGVVLDGDTIGAGIWFGDGQDAVVYYDGDDFIIDPQVVGSGGVIILSMKSGATQVAAGAAADELWKTSGHATLPDNVVMIGV